MGLSYGHVISVLELIVYIPSLSISSLLVHRHGVRKSAGFAFLLLFTMIRIAGACCDLATIKNPKVGLYMAVAVCSAIGLSPLIMACSGLLSRANESIKRRSGNAMSEKYFILIRLLTIIALILSIVAMTSDMSTTALLNPDIKIKVAMILFFIAWAEMCLILAILSLRHKEMEKGEHRLLLAVAVSVVLIFVRLLYSVLVWFLANKTFNFVQGNETVMLVMSILEEFAIVVVCLGVGLTLRVRLPIEKTGSVEETEYHPLQS